MKSVSLCFVNGLCRHSGALRSAPKIGRWARCAAAAAVAAAALSWSPPTPAADLEPDEIFLQAADPAPGILLPVVFSQIAWSPTATPITTFAATDGQYHLQYQLLIT